MRALKLRSLNSRGISHIILPLLIVVGIGVVGSFAVVSSHADDIAKNGNTVVGEQISGTKAAKTKKAALVVYGADKGYDRVRIRIIGADQKTHKCGGSLAKTGMVTKKLSQVKPKSATNVMPATKLTCDAVGGGAYYQVEFGDKKGYGKDVVTTDVDGGYCSIIYPAANKNTKTALSGGKCAEAPNQGKIEAQAATMTIAPKVSKKGVFQGGEIAIKVAGKDLTRVQCTGSLHFSISPSSEKASSPFNSDLPLSYNSGSKSGKDYCHASLLSLVKTLKAKPGTYLTSATLNNAPYFTAADVSGSITLN